MADLRPSPDAERKIFLFTHPRTASNLFLRLFAKHPRLTIIDYPFHGVYMTGLDKLNRRRTEKGTWTQADTDELSTYQCAFDQLQHSISVAEEQGKVPLVKDHALFIMDPNIVAANIPFPSDVSIPEKPVVIDRLASAAAFQGSAESDSTRATCYSSATSSNPTVLPDCFMDSVRPIILIRHPARIIPSYYRAKNKVCFDMDVNDEQFPVDASLRWLRLVFDWYADRIAERGRSSSPEKEPGEDSTAKTQIPLVLDGDDMINDEGVIQALCAALKLDPLHVQYSWDEMPVAAQLYELPHARPFIHTLANSTGIIRNSGMDNDMDVVKEKELWTKEFGSDVANAFEKHVEIAMHDYDYLRSFRLRPS